MCDLLAAIFASNAFGNSIGRDALRGAPITDSAGL